MPLHLSLAFDDTVCRATLLGAPQHILAETPQGHLPQIEELIGDPPGTPNRRRGDPYGAGQRLYRALGGDALCQLLEGSPDGVLLLECDAAAEQVAWEYAATADRRFLACDFGLLRLVPRQANVVDWSKRPRLLVLCADPLTYPGNFVPSYALTFPAELEALGRALAESEAPLDTRRLPPTEARLRAALAGGPAILHFSCHGSQVTLPRADGGQEHDVVLLLEDDDGTARPLLGRDLLSKAPRGSVRMVLLSACQSAPLARSLVAQGVPAALGMQHNFPDPLSGELAAAFYRFLAAGHDVAEAARQARIALAEAHPIVMGLLVAYACQDGWVELPPAEQPATVALGLPQIVRMPGTIAPPSGGLLGRATELALVARKFSAAKTRAVTIVGAGGMGKTALAAAFVARFGWRFRRVIGVTFASDTVSLGRVCRELLERAGLAQAVGAIQSAADLAGRALDQQEAALAARLQDQLLDVIQPGDLLVFDNCESIITPDPGHEAAAGAVMALLPLLIGKGARLLLTSRVHPAGLNGEVTVPDQGDLPGLPLDDAAELFCASSATVNGARSDKAAFERYQVVARKVATVAEGYPLAIQLLASAYDDSAEQDEAFLAAWSERMGRARRAGLGERHARFVTALEYSLVPLAESQRERLRQIAIFEVPFFAEAAALIWALPVDAQGVPTVEALREARQELHRFVKRSLLQIDGRFAETDEVATWRFQPAIRQELHPRAAPAGPPAGYFAYGVWLARRVYGQVGQSPALADLAHRSLTILDTATDVLVGDDRLWHIRRIAWLRQQFGELTLARAQLEQSLALAPEGTAVRGALLHEMANIYRVQGDLPRAVALYEESLAIHEALKDIKGKSATLHEMAYIYRVQGDLPRAMALYEESLAIKEALKDISGKSATLHAMAYIYRVQGDLPRAMALYEESLAIHEALKDIKGKSATLGAIANVHMARQDWDAALAVLEQALTLARQLRDPSAIAFNTVKLGQVAEAQGDLANAAARFREGLAIFERLRMPREAQQVREFLASAEARSAAPIPLETAIQAWAEHDGDTASRQGALVVLLNQAAVRVVQLLRRGDRAAAAELAEQLIPLRTAILRWPAVSPLPPFNAFLGCLQALLRGEVPQLARLRTQLDSGLAQALAEVERQASRDEAALRDEARARQIAELREQIAQAMPNALRDNDQARRAQFAGQLEQMAEQAAEDETPSSPWLALAAYLRACVALLRGQPFEPDGLDGADRAQLERWAAGQVEKADAPALPSDVAAAIEAGDQAALEQALAALPDEQRDTVLERLAEAVRGQLSPEQQAELQRQAQLQQIEQTARQATEATRAALDQGDAQARAALLAKLDEAASYYAEGEAPDSVYQRLAGLLRACAALLRGEPPPAVADEYRALLSQLVSPNMQDSESEAR